MNIFILRGTSFEKMPMHEGIVAACPGVTYIQATTWVNLANPRFAGESLHKYHLRLHEKYLAQMIVNPDSCIDYVTMLLPKDSHDCRIDAIVDGIENPRDLLRVLTAKDKVVFVSRSKRASVEEELAYKAVCNSLAFLGGRCGFNSMQHCSSNDLAEYICQFARELGERTSLDQEPAEQSCNAVKGDK
jgi:3'-phosphoadenosine 5'-phosphosulfate sulfotransferase